MIGDFVHHRYVRRTGRIVRERSHSINVVILAGLFWLGLAVARPLWSDEPRTVAAPDASDTAKSAPASPSDADLEFFENKVRPLLAARCYECHSGTAKTLQGELRLDSRAGALKGGETGPAVAPGDPKNSPLVDAINHGELKMPPKTKLPPEEIATLTKWVEIGAPWPIEAVNAATAANTTAQWEQRKSHWAWQSIQKQTPPPVKDAAWPLADLDCFILAKLEEKKFTPAPPADKRTWLRRVTFDLIGLPTKPDEVAAFLSDDSPQAHAVAVDRLLASPHFGEHWARHWLDLVRYAETRGHEFDYPIPNAYQYRDYVIRALNADVPYDQFVREHLAGDLLEHPRLNPEQGFSESLLGTGFWFLGEEVHSPVDIRQDETDRMDNRLDVMTKTFLGLTVACARCHDHKFDPITQKDYYSLTGFLLGANYRQASFETDEQNRRIAVELDKLRREAKESLLPVWAKAQLPGLQRMDDYMVAAHEVLTKAGTGEVSRELLAEAAGRNGGIDVERLQRWVTELLVAAKTTNHPLHAFAVFPARKEVDENQKPALPKPDQSPLKNRPPGPKPVELTECTQIIADYGREDGKSQPAWFADGFAFGLAPARPGDVRLSDDSSHPFAEIISRGSARRDPAFFGLRPAQGNEREGTMLANWDRSAQTLRTPTATLKSGHVYYLVRGAGRCYAVVDSHLMVQGPLHNRVLHEWNDGPAEWQWVSHDLAPYQGHRCHFEFSPKTPDGDLEIARVVESDKPPPVPGTFNSYINDILTRDAEQGAHLPVRNFAQGYQESMVGALVVMVGGETNDIMSRHPDWAAQLANWCAHHSELFQGDNKTEDAILAELAKPYIARQRELVKQIRRESHSAPVMFEGNGVDDNVLIRGQSKTPGEIAQRRFLEMLGGSAKQGYGPGSGRLALAEQMLAEDNPFISRVIVNRVWHHLMGRGIVSSVDNFGILGQPPTNRELLDYLADRFRHEQNWSLKKLIREVVLSRTYRMSSLPDAKASEADPQNLLWQHAMVRRLPAEAVRDSLLAVSGRLDRTQFGPPVDVYLTQFMEGRGRPGASGPLDGAGRRSIYIKVRRNFLPPMMLAFDTPIPFSTVGRRSVSNVPAQALILLNDPFVADQSRHWATRVLSQPGTAEERIERMYLTAFARPPRADETDAALRFLDDQAAIYGAKDDARRTSLDAWADFGQVLFNAKEFTFLR